MPDSLCYENLFCLCGCGQHIIIRDSHKINGIPKFLPGHYFKSPLDLDRKSQNAIFRESSSSTHIEDVNPRCYIDKNALSERSLANWSNPAYRTKMMAIFRSPGHRAKISCIQKACWSKNHVQRLEIWKSTLRSHGLTPDTIINRSRKYGFFDSTKCKSCIPFASSYELKFLQLSEENPSIFNFRRSNAEIPYIGVDLKKHFYYPDFEILYIDSLRKMIEVKPYSLLNDETVKRKAEAARSFCEKYGMTYEIWTENELKI